MIHLSGNESIFAIDGQHRVEGIRAAILKDPELINEEQAVVFVAHLTTDDGRKQTRRLFATLNTYAQRITDREKVAISEDDSFAKATRQLIEEYPGLGMDLVPLLSTPNIPANEKACITTVVGLFQMTELLAPPEIRRRRKHFHDGPSDEKSVAAIYDATASFWTALKKHIPEIGEVCSSKSADQLAAKYRHADGGHLLFRPVGMKAFAKAARTMMDRGSSADAAVAKLAKVSLDVADELWREVFWRPESKTMLNKYGRLAHNIFLHSVGESPESKKYSVPNEYLRITGRKYSERK